MSVLDFRNHSKARGHCPGLSRHGLLPASLCLTPMGQAAMSARFLERVTPLPNASATSERRRSARYACHDDSMRVMVLLGPEACATKLRDISASGMGCLLDAIVAPGDQLNVEFHNSAKGVWRCKVLQVVHAMPDQGGRWLVGGAFTQSFSAEELASLLPTRRVNHSSTGTGR
jgi:hypothetical protein